MVNPTKATKTPTWLVLVIQSIIERSGASLLELGADTGLKLDLLKAKLGQLIGTGHFSLREGKYYISQPLWTYWVNRGFEEKIPKSPRSIWLDDSPVRDWWPDTYQPKSNQVYYIGPYKQPYLDVYENTIKPTIKGLGLVCLTAFEDPGSEEFLRRKILPALLNSRFVLCDLSERNPNVHYELGWLHAFGTPFYSFTIDKRASDIQHLTIDRYGLSEEELDKLKQKIISSLIKASVIENEPVTKNEVISSLLEKAD